MTLEARLQDLGKTLPQHCVPRGNFLPYRIEGDLVFMAGQICEWNGAVVYAGPVTAEPQAPDHAGSITLEDGRRAAELCALNLLFHLRDACGGRLARVCQVVRVGGFVNCLPGFAHSPYVINGASDLLVNLFGEQGRHARTAVGVAGLPGNASVEVDAIFALDERTRGAASQTHLIVAPSGR